MKLNDLKPKKGSRKLRTRVGRGISAGKGKTAGRGTKGLGARAGANRRLYRQGGNLPFFRRLPFKRGFNPPNRLDFNEVNLDQLVSFAANAEVNPQSLNTARLLRKPARPVAILGRGELKVALKVRAHRVTAGARSKIEDAGGSVEIIQ